MTKADAEIMARGLMNAHGLTDWHIVWKQWLTVGGRCWRDHHWLLFSEPIVQCNNEGDVREIVLHEIAHALTSGGHSMAWRAMAMRIGASGVIMPRLLLPLELIENEIARGVEIKHGLM